MLWRACQYARRDFTARPMRRNLGGPQRAVFGSLFNVTLGANQAMSVNIISGMTTPVLAPTTRTTSMRSRRGSISWGTER